MPSDAAGKRTVVGRLIWEKLLTDVPSFFRGILFEETSCSSRVSHIAAFLPQNESQTPAWCAPVPVGSAAQPGKSQGGQNSVPLGNGNTVVICHKELVGIVSSAISLAVAQELLEPLDIGVYTSLSYPAPRSSSHMAVRSLGEG